MRTWMVGGAALAALMFLGVAGMAQAEDAPDTGLLSLLQASLTPQPDTSTVEGQPDTNLLGDGLDVLGLDASVGSTPPMPGAPDAPAPPPVPGPPAPEAPDAPQPPAAPDVPSPALDELVQSLLETPAPAPVGPAPEEQPTQVPSIAPAVPAVPSTPQSPVGGDPGGASGAGGPATGAATAAVGADLASRMGLGPAFQRDAQGPLDQASSALGLPEPLRQAFAAALGLVFTGLAALAAHMAGFRHVGRENLLEHDFRQRLLALLREHPGMHLREIARQLDLTPTNASYHLRVLERHGVIRSEHAHGRRVYFPAAGRDERERFLAQALLYQAPRAAVLQAIARNPGANQSRLAHITAQHQGAVSWHVRQLIEAGLVEERRTTRACFYDITTLGRALASGAMPAPAGAPPARLAPEAGPHPMVAPMGAPLAAGAAAGEASVPGAGYVA